MTNLTTKITLAKVILRVLPNSEARRELAHAIEYAVSAQSEHAEKRLMLAVSAANAVGA